jgi:hypothetical protein
LGWAASSFLSQLTNTRNKDNNKVDRFKLEDMVFLLNDCFSKLVINSKC